MSNKLHLKDIPIKEVLQQQYLWWNNPKSTPFTYEVLGSKYPEKLVFKKMEWLADHGYLDYGVSLRTAWLTEKAKRLLSLN